MARILIVDESEMERLRVGRLLESASDHVLLYAEDAREALEFIKSEEKVDVVLTDLVIPERDGLSLLDRIFQEHSQIPVILMTSQENDEDTVNALKRGASYCVSKRLLDSTLIQAIERVVSHVHNERRHRQLMTFLNSHSFEFHLDNNRGHIPIMVTYLQELLCSLRVFQPYEVSRIGIAVQEAVVNAMIHGNLEISSSLREGEQPEYERIISERLTVPEFADRRVVLAGELSHSEIQFTVRDEGPGFNPDAVPDPTHPDNVLKSSGRGVLLMRHFMDEVVYNDKGNEVRLIKKCCVPSLEESPLP